MLVVSALLVDAVDGYGKDHAVNNVVLDDSTSALVEFFCDFIALFYN